MYLTNDLLLSLNSDDFIFPFSLSEPRRSDVSKLPFFCTFSLFVIIIIIIIILVLVFFVYSCFSIMRI